jgi:hypothetical protein
MYVIVGLVIANDIFDGKIDYEHPVGAITFSSIHTNVEDAEDAQKNLEIINEKSNIKFNFFIIREKEVKLLNMTERGFEESEVKKEPVEKEPVEKEQAHQEKIESTVVEKMMESFSTLLHSMGVKKHSRNMLDQADVSISNRRKELKDFFIGDKNKLQELRNGYISETANKDMSKIEGVLSHLDDLNGDGMPKCLNDNYT